MITNEGNELMTAIAESVLVQFSLELQERKKKLGEIANSYYLVTFRIYHTPQMVL